MAKNHKGDLNIGRNLRLGNVTDSQKPNIVDQLGGLIWSADNSRVEYSNGIQFLPFGAVATIINSSGMAVQETLPPATGSGNIVFFVNHDIINLATLQVSGMGQSLNGIDDGTFFFSNYSKGTQFRADDHAVGQWTISVFGDNSTSTLDRVYMSTGPAGMANTTQLLDLSDVSFDTGLEIDTNTIIDKTNDKLVIKQAGLYRVTATGSIDPDDTSGAFIQILLNGSVVAETGYDAEGTESRLAFTPTYVGQLSVNDEITFFKTDAGHEWEEVQISLDQLPSTETVLAGLVDPTPTNHVSINGGSATNATVDGAGSYDIIPLGSLSQHVYDPNTMRIGNTIVAPTDGEYEISYSVGSVSTDSVLAIYKNGLLIAEGRSDSTNNRSDAINVIESFSAGDVIEVGVTSTTSVDVARVNVTVKQLAASNIVNPNLVPVEDLWFVSINSTSETSVGVATTTIGAGYDVLDLDHGSLTTRGETGNIDSVNNCITVPAGADGSYEITFLCRSNGSSEDNDIYVDGTQITNYRAQNNNQAGVSSVILDLTSGQQIEFVKSGTATNISITVKRLATKSVINSDDVAVNDQATSGYIDIGNTRIQWGLDNQTGAGRTVTFPQPFANTSYSFVGTADQGGIGIVNIDAAGSTTSIDITVRDGVGSTLNSSFHWQAIGEKP